MTRSTLWTVALLTLAATGCTLPDVHFRPDAPDGSASAEGEPTTRTESAATAADGGMSETTSAAAPAAPATDKAAAPQTQPTRPSAAGSGGSPSSKPQMTSMAGAGAAAPPSAAPTQGPSILPCSVSKVLAQYCQACHAARPIGGAPMSLISYENLHAPAASAPSKRVYELVQQRIHDSKSPMPPGAPLSDPELSILDTWLRSGAPSGTSADAKCDAAPPITSDPSPPTPAANEACYELRVHGSNTAVDNSKLTLSSGERYEEFFFKPPWPQGTVATRFSTNVDNAQLIHHWFMYSTNQAEPEGSHKTAPVPTLIGTEPKLMAAWTAGSPWLSAPDDVGFELPEPTRTINLQWHFVNNSGADLQDASSVQICTVPATARAHIAAFTALGTEDLNGNVWASGAGMPPHKTTTFSSFCVPSRTGLAPNEPIQIVGFMPHMHRLGINMKSEIREPNNLLTPLFDEPYRFGQGSLYVKSHALTPGQQLVTSCTFNNDTDQGVPFGETSDTEMCYQFTLAYPAHALSNGASSLLGNTDVCW